MGSSTVHKTDTDRRLFYPRVLARAGILDKTIERGFIPKDVAWRKPDGTLIAGFDRLEARIDGLPQSVILPVGSLSALLLEEVQDYPSVKIYWANRVSNVGQDSDKAWVEVNGSSNLIYADFVIGCDGGSSTVRKSVSGASFPGSTWPKTLVAVNVSTRLRPSYLVDLCKDSFRLILEV